ncbi:4-alpha-glucanotransferase [Roseomonas xinghualingensis]|uniref:4-alpha-glucanotransferase n=1 Tax=Roseomonas xinghualingensis TaxID=2986475 RepID=UPI0021F1162C|nr:4-alpha-glucanotransferase [Roseomonas sp. SXEYE001]MCV4208820.1 4-alpha-glucanotransferase [Roseomonas sp. SXEYE001]
MSDHNLRELAQAAGIAVEWRDVNGRDNTVSPDAMRAILTALELPAGSEAEIRESRERLRESERGLPPLCTAIQDRPILLGLPDEPEFHLRLESGEIREGRARRQDGLCVLPAVAETGYHHLRIDGQETTLAVCPQRCHGITPGTRPWGVAVQLYSPHRKGDGGIGDFTGLAQLAASAAGHGADAVAISPVHAQFSADPERFSPYAPSSRLFLNVLHADPATLGMDALRAALAETGSAEEFARLESLDLVDWPAASRLRLRLFRAMFDKFPGDAKFDRFRAVGGEALESHARFEALHAHFYGRDPSLWHWRNWPAEFRAPDAPGVADFARKNEREVAFHSFLQWVADRSLSAAQETLKGAGAKIGLIADLAVGTDGGGSHGWSRQEQILSGVGVGAPPDIFSPLGQSWGISAFSPRGLRKSGYAAFLEMLRAAMRHAGGVRIDHAMGLARLWLVPEGRDATEGAYLRFPVQDMLRLVALESHRNEAIVVGEDLGTLPEGFRGQLDETGIMGLRVLYFEQAPDGHFTLPSEWSPGAVAVTTTHDLPTVAGWWKGRDIDWRVKLGLLGEGADGSEQREERARDRANLWEAMCRSGAAEGGMPGEEQGEEVATAAARHVASAACALALLPLEDVLALDEAPNLPGTTEGHPNWRRRLPGDAATLLDAPDAAARLRAFAEAR